MASLHREDLKAVERAGGIGGEPASPLAHTGTVRHAPPQRRNTRYMNAAYSSVPTYQFHIGGISRTTSSASNEVPLPLEYGGIVWSREGAWA